MKPSPIELVLAKLSDAKPNGSGWKACCPAHEDRSPSLSINEGDDGRVLLKCFAGCLNEAIVEALGIEQRDLFRECSSPSNGKVRRSTTKPPLKKRARQHSTCCDWRAFNRFELGCRR